MCEKSAKLLALSASYWVHSQIKAATKRNPDSEEQPRVIVFGYSLGASHAIRFAQGMQHAGIPIELLVTIDSKGFANGKIPPNVKTAANFYERWLYSLLYVFPVYYGKNDLKAEDSVATDFLGNIRVQHAGHFRIVKKSHVGGLICDAVREAYEFEP